MRLSAARRLWKHLAKFETPQPLIPRWFSKVVEECRPRQLTGEQQRHPVHARASSRRASRHSRLQRCFATAPRRASFGLRKSDVLLMPEASSQESTPPARQLVAPRRSALGTVGPEKRPPVGVFRRAWTDGT